MVRVLLLSWATVIALRWVPLNDCALLPDDMIGHVGSTKIQSSNPLVTAPPFLYVLPGSDERDRQAAAEGETKHEQAMTQMNSGRRCGTAARLPQTNAAARSEQSAVLCAVLPLSRTLGPPLPLSSCYTIQAQRHRRVSWLTWVA